MSEPSAHRSFRLPLTLALGLALVACDNGPADPMAAAQQALAASEPRAALLHLAQMSEKDAAYVPSRLLAGEVALMLGNPDRAITELKKIPPAAPEFVVARSWLAEAYLAGGNTNMARKTLADIPLEAERAFAVSAGVALATGDFEAGFALLDQGLTAHPDAPRLIAMDAERIWTNGKPEAALARLAPVLLQSPAVPEAHMLAGQIKLADRQPAEAAIHFNTVLDVRPAQQTAMLALSAIARDRGDTKGSAAWVEKANSAGPAHPVALYFTAQMAYDAGDIDRANSLIEMMPDGLSGMPEFQRLQGFVASARGQRQSAITALQRYFARSEGDPLARRVLAENLAANGELANAWEVIEPVIEHPQADGASLLLALDLAQETGRGDPAAIREVIARRDGSQKLAAPLRKAGLAIRAGDWGKADAILDPLSRDEAMTDPVLLNNSAAVKARLGGYDAAVALARRALAQSPESPEILDTLGWALWQSGEDPDAARTFLDRARQLAPRNREIAEHWQMAHAEQ
ncbi:tetratricopeptide repeat protein [Parerythrobacter jejuensis]|uniref:Tetratricopeptide repeat protein n=1 Tax=Parerythrobacter jejuensis TaxID=795812 RepID=A0A845B533_9SPHN|nr:tetratricopeptide repeat protein [Parerythrobacter jejuensis]MXP31318.1 tetratricopeptide repeat protein [Parerythrobacter jejuensis]MXP34078.1 tetratricopeptide repeat protein [Parerythrobacter jejuensis]